MLHPTDYPKIFGADFARRNSLPVVILGDRQYTKYELGELGCPHIHAARELDKVLKQLGVKNIEDLVSRFSPEDFVGVKGFGITSFYALTCILRSARVSLPSFYKSKVTVPTMIHNARKPKRKRGKAA